MKVKKLCRRAGALVLAAALTLSVTVSAADSMLTKKTGDKATDSTIVTSNTVTRLSSGAVESKLVTNTTSLDKQNIGFFCEVDLSDPTTSLAVGYGSNPDAYTGKAESLSWELVQTGTQAANYEKATGKEVVCALNADLFNMATGEPLGALVMNGTVYHGYNGRPYFGMTKDGKAVIRSSQDLSDLEMAVGGFWMLVEDGKIVDTGYDERAYTRCAVGIKEDGTVVLFSTYGMNAPTSCGQPGTEVARLMLEAGCVTAMMLDCGGSVTYLSRHEGTEELVCRNNPSDGTQRFVASTLLVVSTAQATGTFDHASVSPDNEIYTPESQVQFEATGVDVYGYAADLPSEGLEWKLSDAAMGSIDGETGLFTSNGKTGEVTAQLYYNDQLAGEAAVQIQAPDALSFESKSLALTYNAQSDLGLSATYNTQPVNLKDGDIVWTVRESDANELYEKFGAIGSFAAVETGSKQGLTFTANANKAYSGAATITASYYGKDSLTASLSLEIGKKPQVVMDFEDTDAKVGKVVWDANCVQYCIRVSGSGDKSSADYVPYVTNSYVNAATTANPGEGNYIYSGLGLDGTTTYYVTQTRGGKESAELVSASDEEWTDLIRFGNGALKLNYDFSGAVGIEGADFGPSSEVELDGSATGIGMWVYAPEGTPNLWLRMRIGVTTADGTYKVNYLSFTERADTAYGKDSSDYGGINWTGWRYVYADLSTYQGQGCTVSMLPGEVIRVMYTNGSYGDTTGIGMGNRLKDGTYLAKEDCKGWLLFDNITVLYGTQTEDTTNPTIGNIYYGSSVGDLKELDGATLTSGNLGVFAEAGDNEDTDENATGITTKLVYLDGNLICGMHEQDEYVYALNIYPMNGQHTLTVYVKDANGNVATKTVHFTVQDEKSETPTVDVSLKEGSAPKLGQNVSLELTTSKAESTNQVETTVAIGTAFKVENVAFAEDYSGTWSVSEDNVLTIKAQRSENAAGKGAAQIAEITVSVPSTISSTTSFTYQLTYGTVDGSKTQTLYTFSGTLQRLAVSATYALEADTMVIGQSGTLTVTKDGAAAPGVAVYLADGTEVGKTDAEGKLTTDMFSKNVSFYTAYAYDGDNGYSFQTKFQSYSSQGADANPYYILKNAAKDGSTGKNISWLSNATSGGSGAQLQYYKDGEEATAAQTAKGSSQVVALNSSNDAAQNTAVRANSVSLTGLEPGTTYHYRVGDGTNWSDWQTLTTDDGDSSTSFFVLGDTQADDLTVLKQISEALGDKNSFGIQIGDSLENPTLYSDWSNILSVFSENFSTDMIHVIGNHELFGDAQGNAVSAFYSLENKDYYSVEYGNIYVATIGYTEDRAELAEALEWLVQDAQASDCTWKILTMHQPAYYTNKTGGNEFIYAAVPDAVEKVGINAVFSGHDHSLARTNQLTDDKIDTENGVLYYICGSTGEKSYSITSQDVFDYDTIFALANQEYNAVYLTGTSTENTLTIEIHDTVKGVLDSYTLKLSCYDDGHSYVYNKDSGKAVCSICGSSSDSYTGEIKDADGNEYYMVQGKLKTGWVPMGDDYCYYNGTTGIRETVTETENVPTTCLVRGYRVLTSASGKTKKLNDVKAPGHDYAVQEDGSYVCKVCGHRRIEMSECTITLPYKNMTYTGAARYNTPTVTAPDGTVLTRGTNYGVYYSDNVNVGTATVTVTATKGKLWADITDWRQDYGGTATVTFRILPAAPESVTAKAGETYDAVNLSWTAAGGAEKYIVYASGNDGKTWTRLGETAETSYTATGLDSAAEYQFRVRSTATVRDEAYNSLKFGYSEKITTAAGKSLADCTVTQSWKTITYSGTAKAYKTESIVVKDAEGNTLTRNKDYKISYADNINVGTATVTLTGMGQYSGEKTLNFTIKAQSLANGAKAEAANAVYNAQGAGTTVTVTDKNGNVLTEGTDFTVACADNKAVGTATATITGIGNYTGTLTAAFTITAADLSTAAVTGETTYTYTGSAITPTLTVTAQDGTVLTENQDWKIEKLENNVEAGTAAATIAGMGNYTGTLTFQFTIQPQPEEELTVSFAQEKVEKTQGDAAFAVTAAVKPADAKVTYTTSDEAVAAVNAETGEVTIKAAGTAVITATAEKNGKTATASYTLTVAQKTVSGFTDVEKDSYYEEPVNWAVEKGITTGTTETTFEPEIDCTRAHIVTFLWRAAGEPEPATTDNPFTDVVDTAETNWYYKAVLWAAEKGITTGTTETTFEPDAACTRAQIVTFLWRYAEKPEPTTTVNPFTDVKNTADTDWYYSAVLWGAENGIVKGMTETTFEPDTTCTRAHAVTFLYRALKG